MIRKQTGCIISIILYLIRGNYVFEDIGARFNPNLLGPAWEINLRPKRGKSMFKNRRIEELENKLRALNERFIDQRNCYNTQISIVNKIIKELCLKNDLVLIDKFYCTKEVKELVVTHELLFETDAYSLWSKRK